MTSLVQAAENATLAMRAFLWTLTGPNVKPKTLLQTWEAKMPVDVFDERGLRRRKNRRKKGDMALLRVIGGILEVFFWIFLLIGVIVTIGVMFKFPVVGVFLLACAIAGVIAGIQRIRSGHGSHHG